MDRPAVKFRFSDFQFYMILQRTQRYKTKTYYNYLYIVFLLCINILKHIKNILIYPLFDYIICFLDTFGRPRLFFMMKKPISKILTDR